MAETKFVFKTNKGEIKRIDAAPVLKKEENTKVDTNGVFGYEDAELPEPTILPTAQKTRAKTKLTYQNDVLDFSTESAKGLSDNLPVFIAGESLVGVPKGSITCDSSSLEFDNPECGAKPEKINPISFLYRGV